MTPRKPLPSMQRIVALCYIRKSYTRDSNDMDSPERQRAHIQAFCDRKGWAPEWYQDAEGHKSGRFEINRPAWLALKQRFDDPDVVALVASDLSRIHRKMWRVGKLLDTLDEKDIHLAQAAPGREIDTSTSAGRMLIMILAMQDEAYASDISMRARDSIAYRKSLGKTVGMPPFGTLRTESGFLTPTPFGAWLLSDGRHVAGQQGDPRPDSNAVWRSYFACAQRILELYAENKHGIEAIAYQIASEGWAFRDRKHNPRPVNRDDIRRVVSNWRQYAGLSPIGRARDQNASMIENPTSVLFDTGRAVFPLELLQRVAAVQEKRSVTTRPFGSIKAAHPYALTRLLWCAHCDRKAIEQTNPKLRTRLSGVDQYGKLRYRHAEGVKCSCKSRSVPLDLLDKDFARLIGLLTVRPNAEALLLELAVQSQYGFMSNKAPEEFEEEKQRAIARYGRKLEAARFLFEDGDLSREEYLRRKEECQREIAHWEARTSDIEKAAIELRMCMEAVNHIVQVWETSSDEDRQQVARMLFEEIVYDLDKREIVSFTLKPWASRLLILRAALYDTEMGDEGNGNKNRPSVKQTSDLCSIGESNPCFGLERATSWATRRMEPGTTRSIAEPGGAVKAIFASSGVARCRGVAVLRWGDDKKTAAARFGTALPGGCLQMC